MNEYEELLNMLGKPKMSTARTSEQKPVQKRKRLPAHVRRKIVDKIIWSQELGICLYCKSVLIANQDRILRAKDYGEVGGSVYSKRCYANPEHEHELDPQRIYGAGRRYLTGPDTDNDVTVPPF